MRQEEIAEIKQKIERFTSMSGIRLTTDVKMQARGYLEAILHASENPNEFSIPSNAESAAYLLAAAFEYHLWHKTRLPMNAAGMDKVDRYITAYLAFHTFQSSRSRKLTDTILCSMEPQLIIAGFREQRMFIPFEEDYELMIRKQGADTFLSEGASLHAQSRFERGYFEENTTILKSVGKYFRKFYRDAKNYL